MPKLTQIKESEYIKAKINNYKLYIEYKEYELLVTGNILKYDVDIRMFNPEKSFKENLDYIYSNV
jgi:hypothetical protein